ncbi:hypothetical protein L1987_01089 [Smallanthus sonchifolius]|uniref:Uncharacterized protein n=1 Tax=Smallanthus sonchifolius TaxID=185202 RepID=A0ACB9K444_9ASTR|nr:hypothetical protein L1987_01089 [Smallanthus sonchifolius]
MGTQAHLVYTPLLGSTFNPLRKNKLPIIVKPPPHTTRRGVLHSHISATAPKREKDAKNLVVITGMGVVSVFGNDVDTYYERLLAGESGVGSIDRFDVSEFPTRFAGLIHGFESNGYIKGKHDRRLDDCQRVVTLLERGYKKISPFFTQYILPSMGPAFLAIDLGFMGPTLSIATACATSNYCFCAAANHIREGVADLMIAGGVEACINPVTLRGFVATNALSERNSDPQTASRPWDQGRDGFVMGEGAGVLVMESLEHAMKRDAPIIAEFLGGAINCDAYHITNPRPDAIGITSCIQSCLLNAGVSMEEVNYINAHATSTPAGDLAEITALKKVFKKISGIKMNATKSMIGHPLAAAGGMEAIATIKAIQTGWLHPTINQFNLEPEVEFDTVANHKQQHEINVVRYALDIPSVEMEDGGPGDEENEHVLALFTILKYLNAFCIVDYFPWLRGKIDFDGHEKIIRAAIEGVRKYHDPLIDERILTWNDGTRTQEKDVAPFNDPHVSVKNTVVAGYFIPKGSHVLLSRVGMGRNPDMWKDPMRFDPYRHLGEEGKQVVLTDNELKMLSFSTEKRGCPGVILGSTITTMLLERMIQGFTWELPYNEPTIKLVENNEDLLLAKPLVAIAKPRLPRYLYPKI